MSITIERPDMDEYDIQPVTCARNPSHTSTNWVAHHSGWLQSELHGWLCPDCITELRAEKVVKVTCPTWCNDCGGYDVEDGGYSHHRVWTLQSVGRVVSVYELVDSHGERYACGALLESHDELTVSDLYLVARSAIEAADLMSKHMLTAPQGGAS